MCVEDVEGVVDLMIVSVKLKFGCLFSGVVQVHKASFCLPQFAREKLDPLLTAAPIL